MSDLKDVLIELLEPHPHAGRQGRPTGKTIEGAEGADMYEIVFTDDEGGGCYAYKRDMMLLKPFLGIHKDRAAMPAPLRDRKRGGKR